MIANEQTKLQMYAMVAEAEDRIQEQREQEMAMEEAAKRGSLNVEPMNFSLRRCGFIIDSDALEVRK